MSDNGEEVIISSSGRAIVSGQEINLEEDSSSRVPLCPSWLSQSSPILKCGLSTAGLLFVAFLGVMIVGLTGQMGDSGSSEEFIDAQYEQAVGADTTSKEVATDVQPSARPTVIGFAAVPIESEKVMIALSEEMEQKLLLISDGLSADIPADWTSIQQVIESTIAVSLFEGLPVDYTIGAIEVEEIDGINAQSLEDAVSFAETNHTIIYSSSVIVDCAVSDCNAAPDVVQGAVDQITQMGIVQANEQQFTTIATVTDAVDALDTVDQVDVAAVETTPPPDDNVDQVDEVDTIEVPIETSAPTMKPTTNSPTNPPSDPPSYTPTSEPTLRKQSLSDASCSESTPCDACFGSCSSDKECAKDLLCFRRLYWDNIPGCEGPGRSGQSYCYNPFADGLTKDELLSNKDMKCGDNGYRCGKCEGENCLLTFDKKSSVVTDYFYVY